MDIKEYTNKLLSNYHDDERIICIDRFLEISKCHIMNEILIELKKLNKPFINGEEIQEN